MRIKRRQTRSSKRLLIPKLYSKEITKVAETRKEKNQAGMLVQTEKKKTKSFNHIKVKILSKEALQSLKRS